MDRRYCNKRPVGEKWSDLIFPIEKAPGKDFRLWNDSLDSIAPRGIPMHRLGRRRAKGHKTCNDEDDFWESEEAPATLF